MQNRVEAFSRLITQHTKTLVALLVLLSATQVNASIAVIVNAKSGITALTSKEITNIYLGKPQQTNRNVMLVPLEQQNENTRSAFYMGLMNKPTYMIDAYWARLYFAGRQSPPKRLADNNEIIAQVLQQTNKIAYVDTNAVPKDGKINIILRLE